MGSDRWCCATLSTRTPCRRGRMIGKRASRPKLSARRTSACVGPGHRFDPGRKDRRLRNAVRSRARTARRRARIEQEPRPATCRSSRCAIRSCDHHARGRVTIDADQSDIEQEQLHVALVHRAQRSQPEHDARCALAHARHARAIDSGPAMDRRPPPDASNASDVAVCPPPSGP